MDIIKSGGFKISALEIEAILLTNVNIKEVILNFNPIFEITTTIVRAHCLFDLQLFRCAIYLAQRNNCKSNKQCARTIVVIIPTNWFRLDLC